MQRLQELIGGCHPRLAEARLLGYRLFRRIGFPPEPRSMDDEAVIKGLLTGSLANGKKGAPIFRVGRHRQAIAFGEETLID